MGKLIKKNSYDPQNLNLNQLVELKQGMEQDIKVDIKDKVKELLEVDAQPDIVDFIYTCSVKNNSSKETLLADFQSLFNEVSNNIGYSSINRFHSFVLLNILENKRFRCLDVHQPCAKV